MGALTFPAIPAERVGSDKLLLTLGVTRCWEAYALFGKGKTDGYLKVALSRPGKPRTTGENSQNHAINGAIQTIANWSGHSFDDIKVHMKREAISRGYPFRELKDKTGRVIGVSPYSEAELTTVQAGYLIDTIIQIAAEMDIRVEVGRE